MVVLVLPACVCSNISGMDDNHRHPEWYIFYRQCLQSELRIKNIVARYARQKSGHAACMLQQIKDDITEALRLRIMIDQQQSLIPTYLHYFSREHICSVLYIQLVNMPAPRAMDAAVVIIPRYVGYLRSHPLSSRIYLRIDMRFAAQHPERIPFYLGEQYAFIRQAYNQLALAISWILQSRNAWSSKRPIYDVVHALPYDAGLLYPRIAKLMRWLISKELSYLQEVRQSHDRITPHVDVLDDQHVRSHRHACMAYPESSSFPESRNTLACIDRELDALRFACDNIVICEPLTYTAIIQDLYKQEPNIAATFTFRAHVLAKYSLMRRMLGP